MFSIDRLLNKSVPSELFDFVSECKSGDELVKKLEEDPSRLFAFIQNMNVLGNESIATRLLYKVNPDYLDNAQVKKVETTLRNLGMLNRKVEPTITLVVEGGEPVMAHKSILALASRYFKAMKGFDEFQKGKVEVKEAELSPEVCKLVMDYIYLSDDKRKDFISTVNESLLLEMAKLSFHWKIDELNNLCDDGLCNSIGGFSIEKSDLDDWMKLSRVIPKFTKLLSFINRVAKKEEEEEEEEGEEFRTIIDQMQTPERAAKFAAMCTPEEIELFATLKTEFGKACQIPQGTFGVAEWEKTFPVTIEDVPPLPPNIHAILENDDPYEPGKKLKETCQFFLRPEKVILHEEGEDRELTLGFDEVEELASIATNPELRTKYDTFADLRDQMNKMSVAASGWVLMRKEVIPGSRNLSFADQKKLLEGGFEVPKAMDAILLNIITYANSGRCLYGREPRTYTRCHEQYHEQYKEYQIGVGGWAPSGLSVIYYYFDYGSSGLSGSWKF